VGLMEELTNIPPTLMAGDSATWRASLPDYPASAGWSLSYVLINAAGKLTIASTADGDDHLVSLESATTAAYPPGRYGYTALVSLSGDRIAVGSGSIEILPDVASLDSLDSRTFAEKTLDALEAVISGKASKDQLQYALNGMSLARYTWDELIKARNYFRGEVQKEQRAKAGKKANKVYVRFS